MASTIITWLTEGSTVLPKERFLTLYPKTQLDSTVSMVPIVWHHLGLYRCTWRQGYFRIDIVNVVIIVFRIFISDFSIKLNLPLYSDTNLMICNHWRIIILSQFAEVHAAYWPSISSKYHWVGYFRWNVNWAESDVIPSWNIINCIKFS
jgi:hypothetical protein